MDDTILSISNFTLHRRVVLCIYIYFTITNSIFKCRHKRNILLLFCILCILMSQIIPFHTLKLFCTWYKEFMPWGVTMPMMLTCRLNNHTMAILTTYKQRIVVFVGAHPITNDSQNFTRVDFRFVTLVTMHVQITSCTLVIVVFFQLPPKVLSFLTSFDSHVNEVFVVFSF